MLSSLFITFLCLLNTQKPNEKLIAICKQENKINVNYMDAMKGITSVRTKIHADTLELIINVAIVSKAKPYKVSISSKIRSIKYGTTIIEVAKLPECSNAKVLSGKKALEYLKHTQ